MEFNIVNLIFINFIIVMGAFSFLINIIEPHLPTIFSQAFRYGKFSYKGKQNSLVSYLEVPKSYFKHFYVFALVWSSIALYYVINCDLALQTPPEFILTFLDWMGTKHREVQVDSTSALIASSLLTLQCSRRFYETHFLQIFSSKSKINLSHYLVGYLHYFGAVLSVLIVSQGFVRDTVPKFISISDLNLMKILCTLIFLISWVLQYKSNVILANLRKNGEGKVFTEKHLMPRGGFFEMVSSPHILFEIIMYVSLLGVMPYNVSWRYVTLWVITNQVEMAWLTHKWYKSTFKSYPVQRRAIIPGII